MRIDLSNEYWKYIAEFDKKLESGDIIEENGVFYIKDDIHSDIKHRLIKPSYSEWLLEKILLSLKT